MIRLLRWLVALVREECELYLAAREALRQMRDLGGLSNDEVDDYLQRSDVPQAK